MDSAGGGGGGKGEEQEAPMAALDGRAAVPCGADRIKTKPTRHKNVSTSSNLDLRSDQTERSGAAVMRHGKREGQWWRRWRSGVEGKTCGVAEYGRRGTLVVEDDLGVGVDDAAVVKRYQN